MGPLSRPASQRAPEDVRARRDRIARGRVKRRAGVLARSALVGIGATIADLGALALMIQGFGLSPAVANVPALLFGVALQYVGNKYLAFGDHSKDHLRQGALFAAVEAGTVVLNAVAFHLLVTETSMPYYAARPAVALAVYLGFSLPLWSRIFKRTPPTSKRGGDPSPTS